MDNDVFFIQTPSGTKDVTLLYGLPLLGWGTAYVESLYSYAHRLALEHRLSLYALRDLLNEQILGGSSLLLSRNFNEISGGSPLSISWSSALSRATGNEGLDCGTLSFLRGFVAEKGLWRAERVVCPQCCLEDMKAGTPRFGRLLWGVESVKCCPIHRRTLVALTDCIDFSLHATGNLSWPFGICPFCRREGYACLLHAQRAASSDELGTARAVAALIAAQRELALLPLWPQKREFRKFAETVGGLTRVAIGAGVCRSGLSRWLGDPRARLTIRGVASLARALNVSLLSFLRGDLQGAKLCHIGNIPRRHPRDRVSDDEVESALESALRRGRGAASAAISLGVDSGVLSRRQPGLYALVTASFREMARVRAEDSRIYYVQQARDCYLTLVKKGVCPTPKNAGFKYRCGPDSAALQLLRIRLGETHLGTPARAKDFPAGALPAFDAAIAEIQQSIRS